MTNFTDVLHHQQLIAPVVDHLDGHLPVLAHREGGASRAVWVHPDTLVGLPFEIPLQVIPGTGKREERLADAARFAAE
jgi:hypothetical protein